MDGMTSHHAVLLSVPTPLEYQLPTLETGIGNEYRLQQIGIDDVRKIINDAHRMPDNGAIERVLVVATQFMTEEAQQALLKIVEEPPLSTRFIFIIPLGYHLLPTLESRFERALLSEETSNTIEFDAFKNSTIAERITLIESATKNKNLVWQSEIKKGLHHYVKNLDSSTQSVETLKDLEYVSRLLLTRGASNKFLLEQLALTLQLK
jgi:DNA polymerase III delta prime subunit